MKDIKKDKNLKKTAELELGESQINNVSGGWGSGIETDVEVGDVKVEGISVGLINKKDIKASITVNTSGTGNTAQNNGGINVGK